MTPAETPGHSALCMVHPLGTHTDAASSSTIGVVPRTLIAPGSQGSVGFTGSSTALGPGGPTTSSQGARRALVSSWRVSPGSEGGGVEHLLLVHP